MPYALTGLPPCGFRLCVLVVKELPPYLIYLEICCPSRICHVLDGILSGVNVFYSFLGKKLNAGFFTCAGNTLRSLALLVLRPHPHRPYGHVGVGVHALATVKVQDDLVPDSWNPDLVLSLFGWLLHKRNLLMALLSQAGNLCKY